MRIWSFGLLTVIGLGLSSCTAKAPDQPQSVNADKPFAAGGTIEMQLDSGDYVVRASADEHIRVSMGGNTANAVAELNTDGTHANLRIRDTPHDNFHALIEVPKSADLTVHLSAGNLHIAQIEGNKNVDSKAGNVGISVPNAKDYSSVNASVKVGDLKAGPFGQSSSGLAPSLTWSGPGKYTLRADLGAGNLEFKPY